MRRIFPIATLALGLLAGCQDSTGSAPHDRLSFTYSGALTGSFSATGAVPATSAPWSSPFAGGLQDSEGYTLTAFAPVSGTTGTRILLLTNQLAGEGTYSSDCDSYEPTDHCFVGIVRFNWSGSTPGTQDGVGMLAQHATLTITSITQTRIKGTFSGTFAGNGQQVTVTDGAFDVPLAHV